MDLAECYLFRFSNQLLDLDALEMDESLRYVFQDIPNGESVLLHFPSEFLKPSSRPKAAQRRKRKPSLSATLQRALASTRQSSVAEVAAAAVDPSQSEAGLFASPVVATVHHDEEILVVDELGQTLSEAFSKTDPGQMMQWVIEQAYPANSANPTRVFYLYPLRWLVNGNKARSLTTATPRLALAHPFTFHMDEASALLDRLAQLPVVSTREVELHQQAVGLSLRSGFEELLSLNLLHEITPFPHQVRTAERVLRRMRGRALLCDEVGLGKTIEAGIILTEYMLRGLVKRVLILTPPSLVEQWKEEVTRKLGLDCVCYDESRFKTARKPWQTFDRIIASLDTAKREPHRDEILETEFDLVIVDEAHHLKNKSTLAWKFVNQLKKKYILLLTATPIENDMSELFNLITLLRPGQLLTEAEYKRRYVDKKDPLQPKNVTELKRLVQNVMIRNRRTTTGVIQSTRMAETLLVAPSAEEQAFYAQLSRFVKSRMQASDEEALRLTRRSRAPATGLKASGERATSLRVHPFVLKNLLRQAGSSVACTLPTLRNSLTADGGGVEAELQALIDMGDRVTMSGKLDALRRIIQSTPDQLVVFTGFVGTQQAVTEFLTQAGIDVVNFHGGMSRAQKEQAIERFRDGTKILVSTESGGEGRNLQFCHCMVNFDIPWNPMRIEQRIGRIHRIGQQHEVSIYNLAAKGTLEEHILHILDAKVNLFQLVVGELDMILGSLDEKREFEDILIDIWVDAKDEQELVNGVEQLGDELLAAKTHYQKVRDLDDRLLSELIENEPS